MAKLSGIGGQLYVNGYDLSGDVGVINAVRDGQNLLDVTAIDKSAMERIPGLADGGIDFTAFFNDATDAAHDVLSPMGSTDKYVTYAVNTTLGRPGWSLTAKQADYAGARAADGSLAFTVQTQTSDGEGLRAGEMLTAGIRTDTAATNGSSVDGTAATAFGAVIFLHVFDFDGTDVTISVEDSANNSAWAALTGASFAEIDAAGHHTERIVLASDAAVRRYLRAVTTTTGGFTSVDFALMLCRRFA